MIDLVLSLDLCVTAHIGSTFTTFYAIDVDPIKPGIYDSIINLTLSL